MSDLISRQVAIDYFVTNVGFHDEDGYPIDDSDELRKIWTDYFDGIPPLQPEKTQLSEEDATKDDCVYRQSVIDTLSVGKIALSRVLDEIDIVGTDREKYSWGLGLIESIIKDIEDLPSAQLERKKGKWIVDALANNIYHCSECGTDAPVEPTGGTEYKSNYCPYCGLDMRGEENETD